MSSSVNINLASGGTAADRARACAPTPIAPISVLLVAEGEAGWLLEVGYVLECADRETAWQRLSTVGFPAQASEIVCVVLGLGESAANQDFCRRLRSIPRTADLPIIAVVEQSGDAAAMLAAGADDFCLRAQAVAELSARLARCLSLREQAVRARRQGALGAARERLHRILHSHLEIEAALQESVAEIAAATGAEACGLIVFDEEVEAAQHSALAASAEGVSLNAASLPRGADTNAAQRGLKPIFSGWPAEQAAPPAEQVWPLFSGARQIGALACAARAQFDGAITAWLDEVAVTLGAALERARLYRRAQRTSRQLIAQLSERQQEIEMQKRLTEEVIDSLPVSLYVVDRQLRIVAWNRNREVGGQGIDRQRVIGRSVLDIFSKMPRQVLEQEFERVFVSGELLRFEQESNLDGVVRHWLISKIPMRLHGETNAVTHVVTLGEEITEQKKMNEAIIHAEKLTGIGRLASGVVHEINNPLATIAACAEALQGRIGETPALPAETQTDFHEYLKIIHDESFRCKTITNSLLEFSRLRQAEKTEIEINYLVEQTLQLVKHHPKFKRLQTIKEAGAELPPVFANEAQMKQVFIAIISNAFDAMDEQGCLRIRTGWYYNKGQRFISAEFIDNGCGIAPADVAKIFEPFFTTKPFGQGTGLGLAVCYGIVSDHRGKIEVDSQVGHGTTMRVLLPPCLKG